MKKLVCLVLLYIAFVSVFGCYHSRDAVIQASNVLLNNERAIVGYLGPEGTYTHEVCKKFFGDEGIYVPFKTVNDAVEDLICGKSNYAVIPQENTIGGVVTDYLDTLISHMDLSVVGEIELPINHNLLVCHGAMLCDVKKVYFHNQGITQVKNWLDEYLPGVEIIEVSSTAERAKIVSESNDISCAVIASLVCSDLYDLDILATGIQNNDSNKTRFYVLYREKPATIPSDRIAFVANGMAKDLPVLMAEIEKQNMTYS